MLEYLSKITAELPQGVKTELGPDATSIGWVYQYALVDRTGQHSSDELRSFQDWNLRYAIQSVPGVSEVATVGGQVRQYQITVNPNALAAYKLPLDAVIDAVRAGNNDVGGRLVEFSGREYMVRGRGYVKSISDLENLPLRSEGGTPVLVKDVATVALGPEMRRGVADLDGEGDAVGGIVVMRQGENALNVIKRIEAKLEELKPSLPKGVEVVTTYDRSELIEHAIGTVKVKLVEEIIVVSIIIMIFLWHIPSAIIPIVTIPVSVALSFIPMYAMGLNANLMSLSGIAISIGVLVDGAIVEVENAYNKIHHWMKDGRKGDFHHVRLEALLEVGPGVFFSLLVIAVAFMPVFTLVDQEGRLFRPLAYSKNLAMAIAAFLAITLDPAMRMMFARIDDVHVRPRWLAWHREPRARRHVLLGGGAPDLEGVLHRLYEPPCRFVLRHPKATIAAAFALVLTTIPVYLSLGSEFMPPLREGTILYMPSAVEPGMSVAEAQKALQVQDKLLHDLPRGGARLRQGRPRQHLHRPGPVHDDGDHRHPEARVRVAREAALVLVMGARVAEGRLAAVLARSHHARGPRERDERGAPAPRHLQRVDHADQGAPRHALDRHPHAGRDQDERRGPRDDRARREGDRGHHHEGPRDAQRLRRARRRAATSSTSS